MQHTHTNTTTQFEVVGNRQTVISSHVTVEEAVAALESLGPICELPYGTLDVVRPGQTVTGEFVHSAPVDDGDESPMNYFGFSPASEQ